MCGIAGIFNYSPKINPEEVSAVLSSSLFSRGPDDSGTYIDHSAILVHRRLSILDLSNAGHQPMQDSHHEYVIVFNGEIYNFSQLRDELTLCGATFKSHTDTEVIINAYRHWGELCLQKFRGMFAFAIYNKLNRSLFLARDRLGIKPLIWTTNNNQFIFGSELAPLTKAGLLIKDVDTQSLGDYLSTGSVRQPKTIYKNAYHLEPGCSMLVKHDGSYTTKRWYDILTRTSELRHKLSRETYTDLVEQLKHLLEETAAYHAVSDVTVGSFLSGGVDSSAVSALLAKHTKGRLKTFTIGFQNQNEVTDELTAAQESALFLETEHHSVVINDADIPDLYTCFANKLDQPSIDGFNTFIVSKHTAKNVKVAISGLGGDELFAGYPHFADIARQQEKNTSPFSWLLKTAHNLRPNNIARQALYRGMTPYQADIFFREYFPRNFIARNLQPPFCNTIHYDNHIITNSKLPPLAEITFAELNGYLLSTLLRDCDVCSMAHSLEVRPLLLDHHIAEFALALPDTAKMKSGRQKAILNDALFDLIAPGCQKRKKSGFELPFGRWLNNVLKQRFNDLLSTSPATTLFTRKYINTIRTSLENPRQARKYWKELVLLSWFYRTQTTL